jgi:hypothetical protein
MTAAALPGDGEMENGQITKLLVVVDSLRAPVALGRNLVSVVGMLSWQLPPVVTEYWLTVAALAIGAAAMPQAKTKQARPAGSGNYALLTRSIPGRHGGLRYNERESRGIAAKRKGRREAPFP